jgi:DNA-directed RNA polymerase specialized sigma24 family protein
MVLKNGLSYQQVAQALGTSVGQVERTYLHLNEQAMLETAMARYVNVDNKKTAIWTVISS